MEMTIILGAVVVIVTTIITTGKFGFDRLSKEIDQLRADIQRVADNSSKDISDLRDETTRQLREMDRPAADLQGGINRRLSRVEILLSNILRWTYNEHQYLVEMNRRIITTEKKIDDINTKQKLKYIGFGGLIGINFSYCRLHTV